MQYNVIFEAVDYLQRIKSLEQELELRKKDYKDYIKSQIGKCSIAYTEENYHIIFEEATLYKEKVDEFT